jgi:hypothetical protein
MSETISPTTVASAQGDGVAPASGKVFRSELKRQASRSAARKAAPTRRAHHARRSER